MKYDLTSRVLHWVSALVILWATISGFYTLVPSIEPHVKQFIASFNVSLTALFIPVFCYRMLHRATSAKPAQINTVTSLEKKIAAVMHLFLYMIVFIVLVTGVLMMDRPIKIFNLVQFNQIFDNANIVKVFKTIHRYATELLAICVFLHIAALIKHEVMGKRILRRML